MSSSSTITDLGLGICLLHGAMMGIILTGNSSILVNGKSSGHTSSIVLGCCGCIGIIIDGSSTVKCNNSGKAKVGSNFIGLFNGVIISGCGSVNIGG